MQDEEARGTPGIVVRQHEGIVVRAPVGADGREIGYAEERGGALGAEADGDEPIVQRGRRCTLAGIVRIERRERGGTVRAIAKAVGGLALVTVAVQRAKVGSITAFGSTALSTAPTSSIESSITWRPDMLTSLRDQYFDLISFGRICSIVLSSVFQTFW